MQDQADVLREQLVEAVAETHEELMEKYFSDGALSTEELNQGLRQAVLQREIYPMCYGDSFNNIGIDQLLNALNAYMPTPAESPGLQVEDGEGNEIVLEPSTDAPLAALVFKTISEHIRRLAIAGMVIKRSDGNSVRHKVTKNGEKVLKFLRTLE